MILCYCETFTVPKFWCVLSLFQGFCGCGWDGKSLVILRFSLIKLMEPRKSRTGKNPSKAFQEGVETDDALGFSGLEGRFQGTGVV